MSTQSRGFCKYCGKEYTRTGMIRHLAACKERNSILESAKGKGGCFELLIYGKYDNDYWLIVQVKETASLKDLDQFIRDIWVECCGHLSSFDINGQLYEATPYNDDFWGEPSKSMNAKLKSVLSVGMTIEYEYDFGSTTPLTIKVLGYNDKASQKDKVVILSRNNPPEILCSRCKKNPAKWVDPIALYEEMPFWCEACYKEDILEGEKDMLEDGEELDIEDIDFDESVEFLSVCNSPRMGVCAYEGSDRYPDQFEPDKKL